MDVISLALALKALKNSSGGGGEGGSDIDFIHEVDDLNITEAETGIYKVNGDFYTYNNDGQIAKIPNLSPQDGISDSFIVIVSKSTQPSINRIKWKWKCVDVQTGDVWGSVTQITNPDTQEVTYNTATFLEETAKNKINTITNSNKASSTQYPSVKAVVDYVDSVLTDITETQY